MHSRTHSCKHGREERNPESTARVTEPLTGRSQSLGGMDPRGYWQACMHGREEWTEPLTGRSQKADVKGTLTGSSQSSGGTDPRGCWQTSVHGWEEWTPAPCYIRTNGVRKSGRDSGRE